VKMTLGAAEPVGALNTSRGPLVGEPALPRALEEVP
jgi:phosphoglycerate dehydrogenase-like enzyme